MIFDRPDWRGRLWYWETLPHLAIFRRQRSWGWEVRYFLLKPVPILVLAQDYLVSSPGTPQTYTSNILWNNDFNTVDDVGGGASGAAAQQSGNASGGGGGEHARYSNYVFPNPGVSTASFNVGPGGVAVSTTPGGGVQGVIGNNGSPSTFDTLVANGGVHGSTGINGGGAGGTGGAGGGLRHPGGRGGNVTGAGNGSATGGGGAAGPFGNGSPGVDTNSSGVATAGGKGDGALGGIAGAGTTTNGVVNNGTAGIELGDGVHGLGGGGGGGRYAQNGAQTSGSGGLYGAGGAGCYNAGQGNNHNTGSTSGAGRQGIVVLSWVPAPTPMTDRALFVMP